MLLLFNQLSASNSSESEEKGKKAEYEAIFKMVIDIAENGSYQKYKDKISTGAYIIYNNNYESLYEVLGNPSKKEKFVESCKLKPEIMRYFAPTNKESSYMIIQTKSEDGSESHWHSIYFKRDETGEIQLESWHKS